MAEMRVSQTVTAQGTGSGPTLAELREFLAQMDAWPTTARVSVRHTQSRDQREGDSWQITVSQ